MQSALNRQALHGDVNPLFNKFVREGENPTTYIPATKRREIYDYMNKTNYTKNFQTQKSPKKSQMHEAAAKTAAQRTDYSVGVEGNTNKSFQAKPQISLGLDASLMTGKNFSLIGPTETHNNYAFTMAKRANNRDKVYSVNIPFSKYSSPFNSMQPGGNSLDSPKKIRSQSGFSSNRFSKSHASTFMRPTTSSPSEFRQDLSHVRKQIDDVCTKSSVKMKFPKNSPYTQSRIQEFKPNQNRKEMIINAKKADFQGQLMNSSIKFTNDERNNKVGYNNSVGGGDAEKDLIIKVQSNKLDASWAEQQDKASKNHLTQMHSNNSNKLKGTRSGVDLSKKTDVYPYSTIAETNFNKARPIYTPKDAEQLQNHYKFHKGTTYSIGNDKQQKAVVSAAQESFVIKQRQENAEILPGRRNQGQLGIKNQNIVPNYAIGDNTPAVRGGNDGNVGVKKRSHSTYNQTQRGIVTNQYIEANGKNKNYRDFIDSNKFDYGYDPNGGSRALSMDKTGTPNHKNRGGLLVNERETFKKNDQKQNFKIQPQMKLANSETKRIGDTLDRFQKNEIDQDFLKRSHMPFAAVHEQINSRGNQRQQASTGFGMTSSSRPFRNQNMVLTNSPNKTQESSVAYQIKRNSEVGNVPFATPHRKAADNARDRNNTLTKTSFAWKMPTVMQ